jgi:hypothetical protein
MAFFAECIPRCMEFKQISSQSEFFDAYKSNGEFILCMKL